MIWGQREYAYPNNIFYSSFFWKIHILIEISNICIVLIFCVWKYRNLLQISKLKSCPNERYKVLFINQGHIN